MQIANAFSGRVGMFQRTALLLAGACVIGTLLSACSKQVDSPEALIASAKDYVAKGDHSAAVIQLKNALQQVPDNGEARLLLGLSLLETRDPASAEKELRRALELKQPESKVFPGLGKSIPSSASCTCWYCVGSRKCVSRVPRVAW